MKKTINGIKFNSIKTAGVERAVWPLILASQQGPDEDGGIINAVDIDWNDAEIPYGDLETGETTTINSTGELLSLVSNMQQEIFVLSAAVAALSENSGNTVIDDNVVVKGSEDSKAQVTVYFNDSYGSVSINGTECESGDESPYRVGTVLNIIATPRVGRSFDHWELNGQEVFTGFNGDGYENRFSLLMYTTMDFNVRAVFA